MAIDPEQRIYVQLDRIEGKLDRHIEAHDDIHDEIEKDLRVRPTRQEIMGLFGGAGVLSGIIFGIVRLAS
jgi:hypothetical protein